MNQELTDIVVVLDWSGSMANVNRSRGPLGREHVTRNVYLRANVHVIVLGLVGLLGFPSLSAGQDVRSAIVKIYTEHRYPDYQQPWNPGFPYTSTGSGVILGDGRILTNAHVVSHETLVRVRRNGSSQKYVARVHAVSHEADLALLTVEDPRFRDGDASVSFGELPRVQQEVVVYGFPGGGDSLSATVGVVSRVEHQTYAHSGVALLAVQIDAAINPGSSGGPVFSDGLLLGVVMQGYASAQNIGYLVPIPVIRHFLEDTADGTLAGIPIAGFHWQPLENESLKRYVGFSEQGKGVLVTRIIPGTPAAGRLRPRDVLVRVDGIDVALDGTIALGPELRTHLAHPIQQHQLGETVALELVREGRLEKVELVLDATARDVRLVTPYQYDHAPSYFIYGGLAFNPLTANYLQSFQGKAPAHLEVYRSGDRRNPGEQVVVLNRVLASEANIGYHEWQDRLVTRVNGVEFRNLRELAALLDASTESFVVFENDQGDTNVLDRQAVEAEHEDLLRTYGIASDRSEDLRVTSAPESAEP